MTQVMDTTDARTSLGVDFEDLIAGGDGPLIQTRRRAMGRFLELGLPTTRDESWKYTSLRDLAALGLSRPAAALPEAGSLEPMLLDPVWPRIVLVNGRVAPELSAIAQGRAGALPVGVRIESLQSAPRESGVLIDEHLSKYAPIESDPFTALNTAMAEDAALIHVAQGVRLDTPIHVLHVTMPGDRPQACHPRVLLVAEPDARVCLVETFASLGPDADTLTNAVSEIVVARGARVEHHRLIEQSSRSWHIGRIQVHQQGGSRFTTFVVPFGGRLVRTDIGAALAGSGCRCDLHGAYLLDAGEHVDNALHVEHASPDCDSRELFKGVLSGRSHGVFTGRILVKEGAQKTDAKQTNASLLLSDRARADARPQLEIFADDVKCTHAATIGQLDEQAIFYLRARGLTDQRARALMVRAFLGEVLDQIGPAPLRERVERLTFERLSALTHAVGTA